jgi:uncharacterized protein (TIGR03437 family)
VFGAFGRLASTYPWGAAHLSGNGRYLFAFDVGPPRSARVVDLQTGLITGCGGYSDEGPYPPPVSHGRLVADDGTAVYVSGMVRPLALIKAGQLVWLLPVLAVEASIDAAAQVLVCPYSPGLGVCHTSQQTCTTIAALAGSTFNTVISADGTRVLFLSASSGLLQIHVVNADGSGLRQVTSDPAGVQTAVMSDDGHKSWYFSGSGRIFQVDLDRGQVQEGLSRTPQLDYSASIAPGSMVSLSGAGFTDQILSAGSVPLPMTLGGVSVKIEGRSAPISSVSPAQIVAQVPWETSAGTSQTNPNDQVFVTAEVSVPADIPPPFVPQLRRSLGSLVAYETLLAVFHEDWSPVTSITPARNGEILHVYGTGLGPVTSHPPDGWPAPVAPLSPTIAPVMCDVPVLFAGLAPGLVGYYQLDLQLEAADYAYNFVYIYCGLDGYIEISFVPASPKSP